MLGPGALATVGVGDISRISILLWIGLTSAAAIRWMLAGMDFDRQFQITDQPDMPSDAELAARYSREPARLFSDAPVLIPRRVRAYWTPHPDPEVERARRRMSRRFQMTVAVGIFGLVLVVVIHVLGG
jgi:hypothetical protein